MRSSSEAVAILRMEIMGFAHVKFSGDLFGPIPGGSAVPIRWMDWCGGGFFERIFSRRCDG